MGPFVLAALRWKQLGRLKCKASVSGCRVCTSAGGTSGGMPSGFRGTVSNGSGAGSPLARWASYSC